MTTSSLKHYIILVSVLLGLTACGSANLNLLSEETVALVSQVKGVPRLLRGDLYRELGERAGVAVNDVVLVRLEESLSLDFRRNLKATLAGPSELVVHQYDSSARVFFLDYGFINIDASRRWPARGGSPVEVVTPTGRVKLFAGRLLIASGRYSQVTSLLLLEGQAEVSNAHGTVLLEGRNQMTRTSFTAAPVAPQTAPADWVEEQQGKFE